MTKETIREKFPKGCRVVTRDKNYLRVNTRERFGIIAGFCDRYGSDEFVRVCWDGWKSESSIAVNSRSLEKLA